MLGPFCIQLISVVQTGNLYAPIAAHVQPTSSQLMQKENLPKCDAVSVNDILECQTEMQVKESAYSQISRNLF
jgi:hypothetical protein